MKDDYFDELVEIENELVGLGYVGSVGMEYFDERYPHLMEKRKRLLLLRRHHRIVMTRAVMAYNCRLRGVKAWKRNSKARVLLMPSLYQNWTLKEVDGYAKYPFIIHKVDMFYLITHLPTGLYAGFKKKLATAKALADDMAASLPWMHGFFRVSIQKYREVSDVINRHPQD